MLWTRTARRRSRQFGMNEIVITGSTGVIGRRAVRELLAAGHRVTGVTRSARGRERLESLGARAVEADVFDEASLRRAFNGADADPATNAEIDAALAAAVGIEALRPREPQDGPLARSQRVSSRRLREASGWAPRMRAGTEIWARIATS